MNDRAEQIINEKRIEMLPNRKIFMVQGYKGDWYNVRLFKNGSYRPYCSCPATTICSHLLAVMTSSTIRTPVRNFRIQKYCGTEPKLAVGKDRGAREAAVGQVKRGNLP